MSLEQQHSEIRNTQTTLVGLRTRMAELWRLRETDPQKWETSGRDMYGQIRIQVYTLSNLQQTRIANLQSLQHSQASRPHTLDNRQQTRVVNGQGLQHSQAPRPHTLENRQQTSLVHAQQHSQASRPQMHSCSQPESANVASAALPQPLPGK